MPVRPSRKASMTSAGSLFFATIRPISALAIASHMTPRLACEDVDLRASTLGMLGRFTLPASSLKLTFGRCSSSLVVIFSSSRPLISSTCPQVVAALSLRTLHLSSSLAPRAVRARRRSCPFATRSSALVPLALTSSRHQPNSTSVAKLAISGCD